MKLIFEGPDNAGKSTILKIVAEKLGVQVRGRILRVEPDEVLAVNKADLQRPGDWIFDRCYWLSDMMYEPIFSGNGSKVARVCTPEYDFPDNRLVYVTCSEELLRARYAAEGDAIYNIDQIIAVKKAYDDFFKTYPKENYVTIDTTKGTAEENADTLITLLKEAGK